MDKNPALWGVIAALVGAGLQPLGVAGPMVGVVLLIAAAIFLGYALRDSFREWFSTTVPLKVAARRFYEEARRSKSYWSAAADRLSVENTPSGRLAYCAHALKNADIRWYAVHQPSTVVEELPAAVVKNCSFVTDAMDILADGRTYTSVRVSSVELRRLLRKVRQGAHDI